MDRQRLLFPIALAAFVSLGLPDGVLGIAWPSMRRTFDLPLSHLGILLAAGTVGYLGASIASGPIVVRLGVGRLLFASSVVMVASLTSFALAPRWPVVIGGAVLAGLGGGAIDAGVNVFAATSCSPRRTTWLHASYGVGAALGPLAVTAVLAAGGSWRDGYGVIAVVLAAMAVTFAVTSGRWPATVRGDVARSTIDPGLGQTLRRPVVVAHVALFLLYTGLEVTAGQWAYSLFTEGRGVPAAVAGTLVAVYWASLTAGRVSFATFFGSAPIDRALRVTMAVAPAATLLIGFGGGGVAAMVGVAALGFALGPMYPLLVAATPLRVGPRFAPHAVGAQVAGGYLGAAVLPGLTGVLARDLGLEIIGPLLTVAAVGVFVLHEMVVRMAARAPVTP